METRGSFEGNLFTPFREPEGGFPNFLSFFGVVSLFEGVSVFFGFFKISLQLYGEIE
jgi:hypothetical protein